MKLIEIIPEPEIFVGIVAPIGTNLAPIINRLSKNFESARYRARALKVTDNFSEITNFVPPDLKLTPSPLFERFNSYIAYGNQIRRTFGDDSFLAALAIQQIVGERFKIGSDRLVRTAFIIHQFKRPEEINLLRAVYGPLFFQISIYSRRTARVDFLTRRFEEEASGTPRNLLKARAEQLVATDEDEVQITHGQRVGRVFHEADFIINTDLGPDKVDSQIDRFVDLLFSSNSITPTKLEYGMFAAHSAALRTSDLSRQVGAAIFSDKGEIKSMGSNEVPKAGGGTYWSDEKNDDREFRRGCDSNEKRKIQLLEEILAKLNLDRDTRIGDLTSTSIMDALEYGRIIHAEMGAITDAARNGVSCRDAILFTTTFPCHMCAKHIVAAGIKQVFYLEPYPKSLAARLHSDSLTIEGGERGQYSNFPAVQFVHFYGITPRRYREFFQRGKRKDKDGNFLEYKDGKRRPFVEIVYPSHANAEDLVLTKMKEIIDVEISKHSLKV